MFRILFFFRRVHISEDTLDCLNGVYEVEPGYGTDRDNYLKDRDVVTYLIKQVEPSRSKRKQSTKPKISSDDDSINKLKKSFKIANALAASANMITANQTKEEDEIVVDWTPEIPFENVIYKNLYYSS